MKLLGTATCFVLFFLLGYYANQPSPIQPKPLEITEESSSFIPPAAILIKGESWRIVPLPTLPSNDLGETSCEQRVIFYADEQVTKEDFRDTLWHEIIHAERCHDMVTDQATWAKVADTKDHRRVFELAQFLSGFVHDNPEFMKWAEEWK